MACRTPPTVAQQWFCPARNLPAFPDPVSPPSAATEILGAVLFGVDAEATTLQQVGRRLEAVLVQAGFRRVRYMGFGCSGFAIMAELEHIDADGTPLAGADRFGPSEDGDAFDIEAIARSLSYAPTGHYRQIVFLVDDVRRSAERMPSAGDMQAHVATGQADLPFGYDELPFGPNDRVRALVYAFHKGEGDLDVQLLAPDGEVNAPLHLSKANIFRALGAPSVF